MNTLVTAVASTLFFLTLTLHNCQVCNGLCSVGKTDSFTYLNGNWTYMGVDSTNNNTDYWAHECYPDIKIVWGNKYVLYSGYIIFDTVNSALYGYCYFENTSPTDCNPSWFITNGTVFKHEPTYIITYCSAFDATDCTDESYQESTLQITPTDGYCINNSSVNSVINDEYKFGGCYRGYPYYAATSGDGAKYIFYNWCYATWDISSDGSTYAYCGSPNFNDCNNNDNDNSATTLITYSDAWSYDYGADIDNCDFPTTVC